MTIRDALAQSVNIVGVKALYLAGIEESLATARSMGITTLTDAERYGLTLVLGGGEVTLLEMTVAYGAFANDGMWYQPKPILTIFAHDNEVLESYTGAPKRVLTPEIAQAVNDILSDNEARTPAFGSNSPLYFADRVVASKTGTTNDYRDAWVIGYTPSVVVGTWAGNSDNTPMVKSVASFILAPMWHDAMKTAMAHFPFSSLSRVARSASTTVVASSVSSFFDPLLGVHELSYWTHRNDADTFGAVQNPYKDQQIAQWGYPVALWAMEQANMALASNELFLNKLAFGIGGRDDVPLEMSIATPERGARVEKEIPTTVAITHSEIENVLQVSYYVQGVYVGSTREYPFSFRFTPQQEGVTVLRAVAESPLGNIEALTTIVVEDPRSSRRET
jgi:membrane carboxypeptidase/penicillin-binding protein PbpC